jgi:hypothetical protein
VTRTIVLGLGDGVFFYFFFFFFFFLIWGDGWKGSGGKKVGRMDGTE